jgi:hypothetical protein
MSTCTQLTLSVATMSSNVKEKYIYENKDIVNTSD